MNKGLLEVVLTFKIRTFYQVRALGGGTDF